MLLLSMGPRLEGEGHPLSTALMPKLSDGQRGRLGARTPALSVPRLVQVRYHLLLNIVEWL